MKSMLKSLMSVAAAALALTSCSTDTTEDVMPNGGSKTLVVNASIDQTRTVMADDHVKLDWATNDQIHLYIGAEATEAEAKSIDPVTGGKITGVTYEDGKTVVYAYYSTGSDKSQGVQKVRLNIPGTQTQTKANVFAGENLPMAAKGTIANGKVNLAFQPLACVLVFNVYGPAENEKIKSIEFTANGCSGYDSKGCNLTIDPVKYTPYSSSKSAKVELTNPATIGATKPTDTKVGENQIYLVVAQAEYPAGSTFTVTTDAGNTYTFTTTSALDCSTNSARVVNLNLSKAAELKPAIEVPTVPQQSAERGDLTIEGIVFKNITDDQIASAQVGVYSDKELTAELTESWLTFKNTVTLADGVLNCEVAANETTESRTAYIGIKCAGVQAAIAVTQVGTGSTPAENVVATYVPGDATIYGYNRGEKVTNVALDNGVVTLAFGNAAYYDPAVRCYAKSTITVSSTSKITKIKFVRSSTKPGNLSTDVGTWSSDTFTWTGESEKVVFTVINDQFRIESMEITYVESKEPEIIVPTVADKQPAEGSTLTIQDIVFKNIEVANVTTGVYSDAELAQPLGDGAWLTIANSDLANGTLSCVVAANEGAERIAYIGIKCGDVQASIAVTQLAKGAVAAPDPTKADLSTIVTGASYGEYSNDAWTVTCGISNDNGTLGSSSKRSDKRNLANYPALNTAMGLSTNDYAAAVISKSALPAGYNTVTLDYGGVVASTMVGIAFSADNGTTWTQIMDFVELSTSASAGSQTYSFTQQKAGCYAFVAKTVAKEAKIKGCKITYSQSQE